MDVLFIDQPAMWSSVEGYLTCGAGILQLLIFLLQATIWSVLQTDYKVRKRALYWDRERRY